MVGSGWGGPRGLGGLISGASAGAESDGVCGPATCKYANASVRLQARWELPCAICGQAYGACIQCAAAHSCMTAFHPLCARAARLHMAAVPDYEDSSESDDAPEPCSDPGQLPSEPAACARAVGRAQGRPEKEDGRASGTSDWIGSGSANGIGGGVADGVGGGDRRRRQRRRQPGVGGTALCDGRRLVCFCARHTAAASAAAAAAAVPAAAFGTCADAAARLALKAGPAASRPNEKPKQSPTASPTKTHGAAQRKCARAAEFGHALRRGARAPEALAAALAKRAFVRAKPYLVRTARAAGAPPRSRCFRLVLAAGQAPTLIPTPNPHVLAASRKRPPDGSRGSAWGSIPCCSDPAAALQLVEVAGPWAPGAVRLNPTAAGQPLRVQTLLALLGARGAVTEAFWGTKEGGGRQVTATGSEVHSGSAVLSLAERMAAMRQTLSQRVTCGVC